MARLFMICLIVLAGVGSWKYDSMKREEYRPVARRPASTTAPRPRASKPKPTEVRPEGKKAPKNVRTKIARISQDVERVRGLQLKKPVDIRFLSREAFAKRWKIDIKKEWPARERRADEYTLVAFGFMSARSSLDKFAEQDVSDAIAGFYEFDTKDLFLIGDERDMGISNSITMAHELTHAMQDQTYNLKAMYSKVEKNDDKELAFRALVEGDASLSESLYLGKQSYDKEELQSAAEEESLTFTSYEEAPPVMGLTFVFPYSIGTPWVKQLYDRDGWKGVNAAYKRVPESTEQILHLDKYYSNDRPVSVRLPNVDRMLGKGWEKLRTDTLGEYQSLILISDGATDVSSLANAAAGWEGDSYSVYGQKKGRGVALVWKSVWESKKDASEFTLALARQQQRLNGNVFGEEMKLRHGALSLDGADASVRIRRVGKQVNLVVTRDTDAVVADRLVKRLLD